MSQAYQASPCCEQVATGLVCQKLVGCGYAEESQNQRIQDDLGSYLVRVTEVNDLECELLGLLLDINDFFHFAAFPVIWAIRWRTSSLGLAA